MTKDGISKAFTSIKPDSAFKGLKDSALARTHADWVIGMNGTRAITGWSSKAYNVGFNKQVVGRVKTPTLALVVARDIEIENFVSQNYFQIVAKFQTSSGEYEATYYDPKFNNKEFSDEDRRVKKNDRIFDLEIVNSIISSCQGKPGNITEDKKERKEYSEALFDLTSLQREANSRFGFRAQQTLQITQGLYQPRSGEGYITYPRTDSRRLPDDYPNQVLETLGKFKNSQYSIYSENILNNKRVNNKDKKVFDSKKVSDHFAIIPTNIIPSSGKLSEPEAKIYDLIVRRFLSIFYPPVLTQETIRDTQVGDFCFRTKGKILIDKGWKEVLESNTTETILNSIEENEEAHCKEIIKNENATKPKSRYTDATLLRAMETAGNDLGNEEVAMAMKNKGIGTPATRANTIEDLIRESYLFRTEEENGKKCIASHIRGRQLIQDLTILNLKRLTEANLTGEWELKLKEMEKEKYSYEDFMSETDKLRDEIIEKAKSVNVDTDTFIRPLGIVCPISKLPVMETFNRYTTDKPDDSTNINKIISGRPVSREEAIQLIESYNGEEGRIELDGFLSRFGTFYKADVVLKNTGKYELDWGQEKEVDLKEKKSLGHFDFVNSEIYYDEKFYYFGKNGKNRISTLILSPYLNSDDDEEKKKFSLPLNEAEKLFKGEKTSILQFKSKRKNARKPFFKARLYLDSKFKPKFEMITPEKKSTKKDVKN
jgi:DNA topoisomerase-3